MIKYVGKSDVGLVRSNNEDALLINEELGIAAVADGMGGAAAGELASSLFVKAVLDVISVKSPPSQENASHLSRQAVQLANRRIIAHTVENPADRGMGCTGELLVFFDHGFSLAHVGDSRTYLLRKQELKLLTRDHSFVQELISRGEMTVAEARAHPMRHVILRSVGQDGELEVDIIEGDIVPGDLFLLCSDGLTDMLDDSSIGEILRMPLRLNEKAQKLVDAAKNAGGRDNITVALCEVSAQG